MVLCLEGGGGGPPAPEDAAAGEPGPGARTLGSLMLNLLAMEKDEGPPPPVGWGGGRVDLGLGSVGGPGGGAR